MRQHLARRLRALNLGIVLSLASIVPALASGCTVPDTLALSSRDTERLENLLDSRSKGLAAALLEPDAAARQELADLYEGLAQTSDVPAGDYRCRTMKLGGGLPLTIYGWFACTIKPDGDGWTITKISGSQRFSGTLTPAGEGLAYRGALNYSDEGPMAYVGDNDRDQVGCLSAVANSDILILELPRPAFESDHDVIELRPAD